MADVDGDWDCVIRTPVGVQRGVLGIRSDGDRFTGTMSSPLGALDLAGRVDGDRLTWKMDIKSPFTMTLTCDATVRGDTIEGGVTAGVFGTSPLSGTRKG